MEELISNMDIKDGNFKNEINMDLNSFSKLPSLISILLINSSKILFLLVELILLVLITLLILGLFSNI